MSNLPTKQDQGKVRLELIPSEITLAMGSAFTYGAEKYGVRNWERRRGLDPDRLYGALQRHLVARMSGEMLDPESGLDHFDHAAASLAMLVATVKRRENERTSKL